MSANAKGISIGRRKSLSRRQLLGAGASAAVAAALGCASRTATGTAGPGATGQAPTGAAGATTEELVFVNGRIHTVDRNNTIATMVSMRNGRFVAVGTGAPVPEPGVRIVDLKGRTVVPGIIDNHNHIVLMGNRPGYHTPLENASSIRDVQEILAARAAGIPRGAWITTIGGFHRNQLFPAAGTRSSADAGGARRGGPEQSRVHLGVVQRSLGHEQLRAGSSSKASRLPYQSRATDRSPLGRRARAARRWRCGRHS